MKIDKVRESFWTIFLTAIKNFFEKLSMAYLFTIHEAIYDLK